MFIIQNANDSEQYYNVNYGMWQYCSRDQASRFSTLGEAQQEASLHLPRSEYRIIAY